MGVLIVKRLAMVLTVLVLLLSFSPAALADSQNDYTLRDEEEFAEIESVLPNDPLLNDTGYLNSGDSSVSAYGVSDGMSIRASYKRYIIEGKGFYNAINGGGQVMELIPEEYEWEIVMEDGTVIQMVKEGGSWIALSYAQPPDDSVEGAELVQDATIDMERVDDKIAEISGGAESIATVDAVCLFVPDFASTKFVVFAFEGEEYFVPYSRRPDFTGLTNGEVYTADELTDILEMTYADLIDYYVNGEGNGDEVGGGRGGKTRASQLGGFDVALICAGGIVVLYAVYRIAKDITKHKSK